MICTILGTSNSFEREISTLNTLRNEAKKLWLVLILYQWFTQYNSYIFSTICMTHVENVGLESNKNPIKSNQTNIFFYLKKVRLRKSFMQNFFPINSLAIYTSYKRIKDKNQRGVILRM